MPIDTKTYEELVAIEKAEYANRIPEADRSVGSDFDIEARVHAAVALGNQNHVEFLQRQILPTTADGDFLVEHADLRGVPERPAQAARGSIHIPLAGGGVPGSIQPSGTTVTTPSGIEYTTDEAAAILLPTWTGKVVGADATETRIPVLLDVSSMQRGHRIEINGVQRTIKEVLVSIQALELYEPLPSPPALSVAINPIAGAFVAVTASIAGADGNREVGDPAGIVPVDANVSGTVEFQESTGGGEPQTPDELRAEVQDVMAVRPGSGNLEHFRRWAKENPTVALSEAFIYPNLRGLGTVTVVPWGVTGARQVGIERLSEILSYIKTQYAYDDDVEVVQHSIQGVGTRVVIEVEPSVGSEPDFVLPAGFGTSGITPSTVSTVAIGAQADLEVLQIGDRIVVPIVIAGRPRTEERTISGISTDGANAHLLELDEPLSVAPNMGVPLYAGGPLYSMILAAMESIFDEMGPGDTLPPTRWPETSESHPGTLLLASIQCAVFGLSGVRNLEVIEPATDIVTFPLFTQEVGEVVILWR